jgi:hypothetical protein
MLSQDGGFGLGPAVFIRENRWSAPGKVSPVPPMKWLWGNPPTLVKV